LDAVQHIDIQTPNWHAERRKGRFHIFLTSDSFWEHLMSTRRINWLFKELPKLVSEKVIDSETATKIRTHYEKKAARKINVQTVLMIFGAIGAVLLGGGIILILAHNWDTFPKYARLFFGFAPLMISLCLGGWVVYTEKNSLVWREITGVLISLLMGAAIAIVGQVYHLSSGIDKFLLLWSIGIIPTIYLLRSNYTLIVFLALITCWSAEVQHKGGHALQYWILLITVVPYLMICFGSLANLKNHAFIKWVMAVSLAVALGISLEKVLPGIWIVVYANFFTVLYLLGCEHEDTLKSLWQKPMQMLGMGGIGCLSFLLAMQWPWDDIGFEHIRQGARFHALVSTVDYVILGLLFFLAIFLYVRMVRRFKLFMNIFASVSVVVIPAFLVPGIGIWIFGVYLCALSFSLIIDVGGVDAQSPLKKYGYLLLLMYFCNIVVMYRGGVSHYWVVALNSFFILLCMQSKLFLEKSSTFLDGLTKFIGFIGGMIFLYMLTFRGMIQWRGHYLQLILIVPILLGVAYQAIPFIKEHKKLGWFLAALPLSGIVASLFPASALLIYNLYFLAMSVGIVLMGLSQSKLSFSNSGLLLAALLILTRFFDSDMSFLGRGVAFILLGILFLGMNIYIVRKRKTGGAA
jgi:uncharacterized membrane protein